jgi:uncharacterized protein YfiM (DUF2279 family)
MITAAAYRLQPYGNDAWSGQDKAQHFLASAMLSAAGNEYANIRATAATAAPLSA